MPSGLPDFSAPNHLNPNGLMVVSAGALSFQANERSAFSGELTILGRLLPTRVIFTGTGTSRIRSLLLRLSFILLILNKLHSTSIGVSLWRNGCSFPRYRAMWPEGETNAYERISGIFPYKHPGSASLGRIGGRHPMWAFRYRIGAWLERPQPSQELGANNCSLQTGQ